MGTFCTTTSIETIMIGSKLTGTAATLLNSAITQSENEIRKYLSKRYDVSSAYFQTSTSTPPIITTICEWLTVGYMHLYLSRGGKESIDRYNTFKKLAMENLQGIADYKMDIYDASGAIIADKSTTSYRVLTTDTNYSPTFNEDNPLNWAIDSDKLTDIGDDRD